MTACGSAVRTESPAAPESPTIDHAGAASGRPSQVTQPTSTAYAGVFMTAGRMIQARYGHAATLLADGRVLITGGDDRRGELAAAELYDPVSGAFTATGAMTATRQGYAATLLRDGRVLITGGEDRSGNQAVALDLPGSAELYDPASGTFVATGPMAAARQAHTATLLADGRVLITGGSIGGRSTDVLATAELYDPVTGELRSSRDDDRGASELHRDPAPRRARADHGRREWQRRPRHGRARRPDDGGFAATGAMNTARASYTATLLADGHVLDRWRLPQRHQQLRHGRALCPASGSFTLTGTMTDTRYRHVATLLRMGASWSSAAMTPTASQSRPPSSTTPPPGTFTPAMAMLAGRSGFTATALRDGRVLIAGGWVQPDNILESAELFR